MRAEAIENPGLPGPPEVAVTAPSQARGQASPALAVLLGLSLSHLLNDLVQSLLPALYPLLKAGFHLDFGQIGLITFVFQGTASLLQPAVGLYTDRRPLPYSLAVGMVLSLAGLALLSVASAYGALLAAFVVVPHGQGSVAWLCLAALAGILVLGTVGRWYAQRLATTPRAAGKSTGAASGRLSRVRIVATIAILLGLIFSKYFYMASFSSYYTFYLIHRFGVPVALAQVYLCVFLGAVAAGTILGGPIGDRFGRKLVIWISILGVLPFSLALPHVNLFWTVMLSVPIGLILASAMPAILVYAQELLPGRIGLVGGLFFGFAFGMGGLGAALLGEMADHVGIERVYDLCAFLPALGLMAVFLPRLR